MAILATIGANVTSLSINEMQSASSFVGFDFDNVWEIGVTEGYPYPTLRSNPHSGTVTPTYPAPVLIIDTPKRNSYYASNRESLAVTGHIEYDLYDVLTIGPITVSVYDDANNCLESVVTSVEGKNKTFETQISIPATDGQIRIESSCAVNGIELRVNRDVCSYILPEPISYMTQITYNDHTYDLLSKSVNVEKDSNVKVTVVVHYPEGTDRDKIYLSQDTRHFIELTNGVPMTFSPGKVFTAGKDIYILILNEETGEADSEQTCLKVVEPGANGEWFPDGDVEGLNFKLGKECGFTIPENVPAFGGAQIKWDFDFIPISVEYDREDNNKINVVFGANIAHNDDEEDKYFKDFDFEEYKKDVKKAASKQGWTLKELRDEFKLSNAYKMNLFGEKVLGGGTGKPSFDFNVAGYAEMNVIGGKLTFVEGQLCLEVEASYTYQGQLFIWVVPVYYEIGGGNGAGIEGKMFNISPETFVPELEAYITAKIKANLGAGVGVSKVATVGVGGEGTLNFKTAIHKKYVKCWGEGNANISVKVLGKTVAKSNFLEGDFLIHETGNPNGMISDDIDVKTYREEPLLAAVEVDRVYENESRSYAVQSTQWYGGPAPAVLTTEPSNINRQLLAESTYTEAAPQICSVDGTKVMVMLWDGESRSDANRTMLVWSAFDEDTRSWTEPLPVCDDGTADFYPNFKDGYLVWQNEKTALTEDMTLEEIAALGEICVARWNGNGFDKPVTLTNNNTLDTLPAVCSDGENAVVVWVNNSANNILGMTGSNTVLEAVGYNAVQTVASGVNAVTNLAVGYADGEVKVACVVDEDNDLQTIDDWELYLNGKKFTDNASVDSNPVFAGDILYYYAAGNICEYSLPSSTTSYVFEDAPYGLSDQFTVSLNGDEAAIWWSAVTESSSDIFCALRKDGEWSRALQLTDVSDQCRYPAGVLEPDGTLYLAYNSGIWWGDEQVKTDLYTMQVTPAYDLAVEDVYADEEKMMVYATVWNQGQLDVDGYTVSLRDWSPNNQLIVTEKLRAGESVDVQIGYIVPGDMSSRYVSLNVSSDSGYEYDLENNEAWVLMGNCDIEVQKIENHEGLPKSSVTVTVANTGYMAAESVVVQLRAGKEDGTVVAEQEIQALSLGENTVVTFTYDPAASENGIWYVTAAVQDEEMTVSNNADYFINDCCLNLREFEGRILQCKTVGAAMTVYANITNNTSAEETLLLIAAVYSADGRQKCVDTQPVGVDEYASAASVFEFEGYIREIGDYLKLFAVDDDGSLRPLIDAQSEGVYINV